MVGALDLLDACIFFGIRNHVGPVRIFQSIAAGLFGRASFTGGAKTAVLGVLLHFLIASIIAAVYYLFSLKIPALINHAVLLGMTYGVAVYFVMNYVVIPLSATRRPAFTLAVFLNGILGHALLVGLPVALITRRSAKAN